MKIELLSRDGTSRTIGTASSIPICLDLDLGPGWVERDGLVWTADKAEAYPDDDGGYSSAVILCDGVRTALDCLPQISDKPGYCPRLDKIIATGADGGFILYSPAEWESVSSADCEADAAGLIYCQGTPTGDRLTAEEMQSAI